jgi:hypothetical protein
MKTKMLFPGIVVVLVLLGALVFVMARSRANRNSPAPSRESNPTYLQGQSKARAQEKTARNLSLQPEAFNLGRRLGQRFSTSMRGQSTLVGTLTIAGERRNVRITRRQTDDGERIEIDLAGASGPLTWDSSQGSFSSGARANGTDRQLIERLVLDSPDQFVLGQLRGASYYTVARNVRPVTAVDGYAGPVWNVVRVDDPEQDETKRPQSRWRLYYINTRTGLIDRIVSELNGAEIIAEISEWDDRNGEKTPALINWRRADQMLMQYRLVNFSHVQQ